MKKRKPNINNLSKRGFKVGDLVSYICYGSMIADNEEVEKHGIVIESIHSIVKVRPLTNFSTITLVNTADCRLVKREDSGQV